MNAVNSVIAKLVAVLLAPFEHAPATGLVVIGLAMGVVAALCFRFTSNQRALRRVADSSRANLLTLWLFRDEIGVALRAIVGLLGAALARLALSIPPLLVMLVPFGLLLTHMAMYYEFRPFTTAETRGGQTAILEVQFSPQTWTSYALGKPDVVPDGIELDARVARAETSTVTWRIRASQPIDDAFEFTVAPGQSIAKQIAVRDDPHLLRRASPRRAGENFWDRVLYPAEPAFSSNDPVRHIAIPYPQRSTPILGWNMPWWLTFLIASIIGALLVKPFVRVQF